MFDNPTSNPSLADQLPAEAYGHLIRSLRLTLPPPPGDSEQDLLRRDHAAIAAVAGLVPGNAAEARLAAQFVAASEQWMDCLRLAQLPETTAEWAAKCRAQALGMMRQANSALRLLLSLQQAREKREATNAGCDRAAWTEHCAIALMAEALSRRPHPDPLGATPQNRADFAGTPAGGEGEGATFPLPVGEGQGEGQAAPAAVSEIAVPPPPPEPKPKPAPVAEPELESPCPESLFAVAEAEQYAIMYPERAALIRRLGRVPEDASFGPPDNDLVQALVAGRTPGLAAAVSRNGQ